MIARTASEKRRYPRIKVCFLVSYRTRYAPNKYLGNQTHEDQYYLGQTKNVGQGGMLLITNKKYESNTYLETIISFPFLPGRVTITGKVVDSQEVKRNRAYDTRVQFISTETTLQAKLSEFIKMRTDLP